MDSHPPSAHSPKSAPPDLSPGQIELLDAQTLLGIYLAPWPLGLPRDRWWSTSGKYGREYDAAAHLSEAVTTRSFANLFGQHTSMLRALKANKQRHPIVSESRAETPDWERCRWFYIGDRPAGPPPRQIHGDWKRAQQRAQQLAPPPAASEPSLSRDDEMSEDSDGEVARINATARSARADQPAPARRPASAAAHLPSQQLTPPDSPVTRFCVGKRPESGKWESVSQKYPPDVFHPRLPPAGPPSEDDLLDVLREHSQTDEPSANTPAAGDAAPATTSASRRSAARRESAAQRRDSQSRPPPQSPEEAAHGFLTAIRNMSRADRRHAVHALYKSASAELKGDVSYIFGEPKIRRPEAIYEREFAALRHAQRRASAVRAADAAGLWARLKVGTKAERANLAGTAASFVMQPDGGFLTEGLDVTWDRQRQVRAAPHGLPAVANPQHTRADLAKLTHMHPTVRTGCQRHGREPSRRSALEQTAKTPRA